jgi:TGS domain
VVHECPELEPVGAIGRIEWGPSARFDGQRVGRDHAVHDGDVIEILS